MAPGYSLLKFHGTYQGYDRDSATERKQRGDDKLWQFMVRVRIPGGRLTAEQYLALDDLADRYANGTLRVTTRQSIQFHGVLKSGLKATIAGINQRPADDAGGVRRCRAHRDDGAGADPRRGTPAGSRTTRGVSRRICCRRPAPITRSGSTAKR